MRQDYGQKLPLEARIEGRARQIGSEIKEAATRLREEGLPERAIAGFMATHEYIYEMVRRTSLRGSDKEKFILEIQSAIRTLAHGLTMGDGTQRREEQLNIAHGGELLAKEISAALKRANQTGTRGGDETTLVSEHEV